MSPAFFLPRIYIHWSSLLLFYIDFYCFQFLFSYQTAILFTSTQYYPRCIWFLNLIYSALFVICYFSLSLSDITASYCFCVFTVWCMRVLAVSDIVECCQENAKDGDRRVRHLRPPIGRFTGFAWASSTWLVAHLAVIFNRVFGKKK